MERKRVVLEVIIDLDPVPGTFHTPESAEEVVQAILNSSIPHYHPNVKIKK